MVNVGKHTYFGGTYQIRRWLATEDIVIGDFCSIGGEVLIMAGGNHRYDRVSTFPFDAKLAMSSFGDGSYATTRSTLIGNDVWIGSRSTILGGARIGHGCVVAAGSVVFGQRFPPYAVIAGNPAEIKYFRFPQDVIDALLRIKWWDWPDELIKERIDWFNKPAREFVENFAIPAEDTLPDSM